MNINNNNNNNNNNNKLKTARSLKNSKIGTWVQTKEVWEHELVPAEKLVAVISAGQLMHIFFSSVIMPKYLNRWFSITGSKKKAERKEEGKKVQGPIVFFKSIDNDFSKANNVVHKPSLDLFLKSVQMQISNKKST